MMSWVRAGQVPHDSMMQGKRLSQNNELASSLTKKVLIVDVTHSQVAA